MYSTAVILTVVLSVARNASSFVVTGPSAAHVQNSLRPERHFPPLFHSKLQRRLPSPLSMSGNHNVVDSEDPFVILNLNPTADKREIKRAYKRAALKFHPDVVCNSSSTKEERRTANDVFAKINWAYEQLNGKQSTTTGKQSSSTSTQPPPHRRKQTSYSSGSNTASSTDWRDYIPNFQQEQEQYDAGGDSFGAIFSDLLGAAASTAAGGGGVFRDFVEFLEQNVDGYTTTPDDDNDLRTLLTYGTKEEVAMEMDDTQLVVSSLEAKQKNVKDELLTKTADLKFAQKFSEKVELEERIAELQARKRVVDGYLTTARKRLLSLQSRYKELVVGGRVSEHPPPRGGYTRSSYEPKGDASSTYSSRSSSSSTSTGASGRRASTTTTSSSTSGETESEWKTQGFGSSGRGRGSSSRRGRSRPRTERNTTQEEPQTRARPSSSTWNNNEPSSPRQEKSSRPPPTSTPTRTSLSTSDDWKAPIPPHRRPKSEPSQAQKDKKRLRELQVDDEFDKLKKELGL